MYTFVLTLAPCFTKIRGDFQVFNTSARMLASYGDKRLTRYQERPLSVGPTLYLYLFFLVFQNDYIITTFVKMDFG